MEIVASLFQGRTAAAQCGLFTYKSVQVLFEPPCIITAKWLQAVKLCFISRYFGDDDGGRGGRSVDFYDCYVVSECISLERLVVRDSLNSGLHKIVSN